MSPITEQALSLESPVANPDEARDLDSQRASSFLDVFKHLLFDAYFAGFQLSSRNWNGEYPGTVTQDDIKDDFDAWFPIARFPTSQAAAEQASPTLPPGRGFLRT